MSSFEQNDAAHRIKNPKKAKSDLITELTDALGCPARKARSFLEDESVPCSKFAARFSPIFLKLVDDVIRQFRDIKARRLASPPNKLSRLTIDKRNVCGC
jgi:hypothetical protein